MKTQYLLKLKILLLLIVTWNNTYAHKAINEKAELLWSKKGIIINLYAIKSSRSLENNLFTGFLKIKMSELLKDKLFYFNNSHMNLDSLESWLDVKNRYYTSGLDSFLKSGNTASESINSVNGINTVATVVCDNIGFESGTSLSDFNANWVLKNGFACPGTGCNSFSAITVTSLPLDNLTTHYSITSSGFDMNIPNNVLPVVKPGSTYSFRLENYDLGGDAMQLSRVIGVDASKPYFKYSFAAVLEDPGNTHEDLHKPYFNVRIKDPNGNVIKCSEYAAVANPALAEIKENFIYCSSMGMDLYYRYWTDVIIPLDAYIGQNVTVEFTVSDCAWGGHLAYVYLDGDCLNPTLSSGNCISTSDPSRILTAPSDFNHYSWTGPGIIGSNSKQTVKVGKAGTYTVRLTSRGGCPGFINTTVTACSSSISNCSLSVSNITPSSCNAENNTYSLSGNIDLSSAYLSSGVIGITIGNITKYLYAPFTSNFAFSIPDIYTTGATIPYTVKYYPSNFIGEAPCSAQGTFQSPETCYDVNMNCSNCIGSFKPEIGKTYIVSAWVKDNSASAQTVTYVNPYIEISFNNGSTTLSPIYAEGKIIEGWQRIYYEFTIPLGTTEISVALKTASGTADFDDIRVHPVDAGFTSYVYDPISLKLVAVLDDNNYATFYEYDKEGTLIRTKKETVRGVLTITENRENNPKR